ncbi:MAG TPA: alpha/beta fold hydrolase [Microbacterium sp.]|nr:alpha/beta fold hydrolase [Microbacterium sp.]
MPEFIDAHGIAIVYDVHTPPTPPRGVVQLVHGVGEHAGRYTAIIDAIVAEGWTVYADDHRGHGRTGMKQHGDDATKLGMLGPGGLRAAVAALWQFTQLIRAENPRLPLVLLGHSWGSFMSQMLLNQHPDAYDGVILSGTALRWPGSLNARPLNAKWRAESATGVEWLCSDAAVGQAFLDDPLTTVTPLAKLFGPIDTLRIIGKPKKNLGRDVPVLIMVGRDDPVGGPVSAHRLAAAYQERSKLTDVTTLIYPNARHEIFNEVQQKDVRGDLLAWLDRRFPVRD